MFKFNFSFVFTLFLPLLTTNNSALAKLSNSVSTVQLDDSSTLNITYLKANNVELKLDIYASRNAEENVPTLIYFHGSGHSNFTGNEILDISDSIQNLNTPVVVSRKFNLAEYDYIVSQFDGNNNDKDDIAALPIAAALTNAIGLQQKSIFFYNNNLSEPNDKNQLKQMRKSAAFAEKLGIKTVDYQTDLSAATNKLVQIFNSGKKVLSLEGGPMEAVYRGLEQTSKENLKNITLISHSNWNEDRDLGTSPSGGKPRTWQDIKNNFPEVTLIEIADQNGVWLGSYHDDNTGFQNPDWEWLDSTKNLVLKEARDLMANAEYKVNDPSDAGMHFFAFTGIETGDPNDVQQFFAANPPEFISTSELIDEPIASSITPFNLVTGSYQGHFTNEGIPSFNEFRAINPLLLVHEGVATRTCGETARSGFMYLVLNLGYHTN